MIVLWRAGDYGGDHEGNETLFFEVGDRSIDGIALALQLVDANGSVRGTTAAIEWESDSASSSWLEHIHSESLGSRFQDDQINEFKAHLNQLPTVILADLAQHMATMGRPRDPQDVFAREVIAEHHWRTRPCRRGRRA